MKRKKSRKSLSNKKHNATNTIADQLNIFLEKVNFNDQNVFDNFVQIEIDQTTNVSEMLHFTSINFKLRNYWESSLETGDTTDDNVKCFIITSSRRKFFLFETTDTKQTLYELDNDGDNVQQSTQRLQSDHFHHRFTNQILKKRRFFSINVEHIDPKTLTLNWFLSKNFIFVDLNSFKLALEASKNDFILSLMAFSRGQYLESFQNSNCSNEFKDNAEIEEFYRKIIIKQSNDLKNNENFQNIEINSQNLRPKLWNHQISALKWMLMREKCLNNNDGQDYCQRSFEKLTNSTDGTVYYVHKTLGHIIAESVYENYKNCLRQFHAKGGILADEMGLGKTVDVIGLILNNPADGIHGKNSQFQINKENLFIYSTDPLSGQLRCHCRIETDDQNSMVKVPKLNLKQLRNRCIEQQYFLIDNLIKCLLCGNYQHFECSDYSIEQSGQFAYACSHCWQQISMKIDSSATLIVCPTSILNQWIQELRLHIDKCDLRIYKYNGVKCKEYKYPSELARNDIVVTTYEILKSELDFIAVHDYSHLRNDRRYYAPISPLCSIRWWRLVFDEAQLVEGRTTRIFRMAKSLHSVNRWTVTGTPIQRNLEDLFGLVNFVGQKPYDIENVWKNDLLIPYSHGKGDNLISVMAKCFWRTSKTSVFEEIKISKPITCIEQCELSQIERDFYLQESSACQQSMMLKLRNISNDLKISDLSNSLQSAIFNSALRLRQLCCHPQMCLRMKIDDYCSIQDVLDKMIDDTKYDCEKSHREKIASINGMAACYLLQNDFKTAIQMYKEALESIDNIGDDIRTDKTQKYHIYYNLAQILEFIGCKQIDSNGSSLPSFNGTQPIIISNDSKPSATELSITIESNDQYLRLKAKQLYENYLNASQLSLLTADRYRCELIRKCDEIQRKFSFPTGKWLIYALKELKNVPNHDEIVAVLNEILSNRSEQIVDAPLSTRSFESIRWQLCSYLDSFEQLRQQIRDAFKLLDRDSLRNDPYRYINCHIRPSSKEDAKSKEKRCHLCNTEVIIKDFEKIIFKFEPSIIRKNAFEINQDNDQDRINEEADNWNENLCLKAIRKVGSLFKSRTIGQAKDYDLTVGDIDNFNHYIDECRKEYKEHRKCWRLSSELVLRIDELNQAQTRYEYGVDSLSLFHRDSSAKELAEEKLCGNQQRLKYLNNLKNTLKDKDNNIDTKVCSVCWSDLIRYSVLTCGHLLCISCLNNIKKYSEIKRCPVCRSVFDQQRICIVDTSLLLKKTSVEGNWSSKIVAIIRCIKEIKGEKILIFSTWLRMLQLMVKALKMNHIESLLISGSGDNKFSAKIDQFRQSSEYQCLLLPLKFACKGLNLIEASRIIFINPILNKRDEQQAIGRINRIGQTRQTYVHKFIIKESIEELIENYDKNCANHRSKNSNDEFNDLTVGEFCTLFNIYK